jgi:hypothetical protein
MATTASASHAERNYHDTNAVYTLPNEYFTTHVLHVPSDLAPAPQSTNASKPKPHDSPN